MQCPEGRSMSTSNQPSNDKLFVARALEATIRIGLVVLLLYWCFQIGRPFIQIIVWGIIIAVAKGCKPAGPRSISRNQKCLVL